MNNKVFHDAWTLAVACTEPAAPDAGDPVRFGFLTGVAVEDENAAGVTVVDFGQRVYDLSVDDDVGGGIAVGDTLYYDSATDALDNDTGGTPFGYALETVGANATTVIRVLHVPGHGAATLGAGVVSAANLAANAVETAKVKDKNITGVKIADGALNVTLLAGAAAGDHALAGMAVGDEIVFVGHLSTAAAIATMGDLTSEFTAAAGKMTNVAGTDTTDDQLMVIWIDKT
jgi:predicted RecA/RadA family phage recombinase